MRTKIGDYLRGLRTSKDISLRTMANDLGISPAFLSAVENGKKKMPDSWFSLIPDTYHFDESAVEEFRDIAYESLEVVELNIANVSESNKKLAIRFARRFEEIDEKTSEELLKLFEEKLRGKHKDE